MHKLNIIINRLKNVTPEYVMRQESDLKLEVEMTEGRLETLFYKIWAEVGDEKLTEWIRRENYNLVDINKAEKLAIEAMKTKWAHCFIGDRLIYTRPHPLGFWSDVDSWILGYNAKT